MPYIDIDGTGLYYEEAGNGEPVVFVHGNWSDYSTWGLTVPELPESLRAIVYDRRGFGRSQRTRERLTRRLHEDDLAGVIEALGPGPAHVVGNSYGASTALGLAARRPELFRSLVVHEPPLVAVVGDDPAARAAIAQTQASLAAWSSASRRAIWPEPPSSSWRRWRSVPADGQPCPSGAGRP